MKSRRLALFLLWYAECRAEEADANGCYPPKTICRDQPKPMAGPTNRTWTENLGRTDPILCAVPDLPDYGQGWCCPPGQCASSPSVPQAPAECVDTNKTYCIGNRNRFVDSCSGREFAARCPKTCDVPGCMTKQAVLPKGCEEEDPAGCADRRTITKDSCADDQRFRTACQSTCGDCTPILPPQYHGGGGSGSPSTPDDGGTRLPQRDYEEQPPAVGGCLDPPPHAQKRELEAECDDQSDDYRRAANRELLFSSTPGSMMGTSDGDGDVATSHLDAYKLLVGANGTAAACRFATNPNHTKVEVETVTAEACAAACDQPQANCGSFEVKTEVGDKYCATWSKGACIGPESEGYIHEACNQCVRTYVRRDNAAVDQVDSEDQPSIGLVERVH